MAAGAEGRAIAENIRSAMVRTGKSVADLTLLTGIAERTIYRKIGPAPDDFRLGELVILAEALETDFETLVNIERVPA